MEKQREDRRLRRPSFITRLLGHFMDVYGSKVGTWIVGVIELDKNPGKELLKDILSERLLCMSRFQSVLKMNKRGGRFEKVALEEMDWEYHLETFSDSKSMTEEELINFVGELNDGKTLRSDKPLWKMILVPKVVGGGHNKRTGTALVSVINHALADGVSGVGVLLKLLDDSPVDPFLPLHEQSLTNERKFIVEKRKKKPKVKFLRRLGVFFDGIYEGLIGTLGGKEDPPNRLKLKKGKDFFTSYSGKKLLAKSESIPLETIKYLKNKFEGATVNDILLTLLTLTVKAYLKSIDDPIVAVSKKKKKIKFRGQFAVNLRNPKDPILKNKNPSNLWGPLDFRFPIETESCIDCFFAVKDQIDMKKVSPQIMIQYWTAKIGTKLIPRKTFLKMVLSLADKGTCELSNVPGPQKKVHIGGATVTDLGFYVFSPQGLYLGIMSYDQKVSLSVNIDVELNVEPKDITKHWNEQLERFIDEVQAYPDSIPRKAKERLTAQKPQLNLLNILH